MSFSSLLKVRGTIVVVVAGAVGVVPEGDMEEAMKQAARRHLPLQIQASSQLWEPSEELTEWKLCLCIGSPQKL